MAMQLVPMICPECHGQIQVPANVKTCYCTYCGTQIFFDDGARHVHVHNYDEAEIRRIEFEQQLELERLEEERREEQAYNVHAHRWRIGIIAWVALIIVFLVASDPVERASRDAYRTLCLLGGGLLFFGPIALFFTRPRRRRKRR